MPAKAQVDAAQAIVARQWHHLAHLLRVDLVHLIAHVATHAGDIVIVVQLPLADGNDHALALVFGGIAEQFIHHRPQALFFIEQRALIVRGAAAVAA